MAFPSTLTSLTNPNATDKLNSPSHSSIETAQNTAITQLENVIGLAGSSSALGTLIGDLRSPDSGGGGHVQAANKGGTGQTTFTKGDILVATSASVITKLSVGADGTSLRSNSSTASGVEWTSAQVNTQSFLSTGTWTKPGGATNVFVQLWGGGGAGGRASTAGAAGGGGGGAYVEGWIVASALGSTELVVVGVGAPSIATANTKGSVGGVTVFGSTTSYLSAWGGGGGSNSAGGGGGGGGSLSHGFVSSNVSGANGGGPVGGITATGAQFGGSGGANGAADGFAPTSAGFGFYGGAGGGGGSLDSADKNGGDGAGALHSGAGGGGSARVATSGSAGAGGTSKLGGNGGNGGKGLSSAMSGFQPGGGGGGSTDGNSGKGGDGKAIITTFL